ncbi:hypothetical protein ACFOD4_00520 [Pseudoroseomonas globiformis]|uniref:Lipoprotein n=1 Tax=Teichococcus globiformis TaxID=2307229 RepID=A0ABV7FVT8_9PROT
MLLRARLVLVLPLLGACAGWEKPGTDAAQRDAALARCEGQAGGIAPQWETVVERPGRFVPSFVECGADGRSCRSTGGYFDSPQYRSRDSAAPLREAVVESCMQEQGWRRTGGL